MTLFCTTYASPPAREGLLGPDAKSQVTVEYRDGRPARAHTIVVSHMHAAGLAKTDLEEIVRASLVAVLPPGWVDASTRVLVNPSGSFVHGGPAADTGLTGRKIIVDTYGGAAPHGGGAFSGKDPTKVDRSAVYAARHLAKNIVAAGLGLPPAGPELRRKPLTVVLPASDGPKVVRRLCVEDGGFSLHAASRAEPRGG